MGSCISMPVTVGKSKSQVPSSGSPLLIYSPKSIVLWGPEPFGDPWHEGYLAVFNQSQGLAPAC